LDFSDLGQDLDQLGAAVFLTVFIDRADRDAAHARRQVAGQGGGPEVGRVAQRRPEYRTVLDANVQLGDQASTRADRAIAAAGRQSMAN
jgi:hypothetical protein